jgi:hypothetical protein
MQLYPKLCGRFGDKELILGEEPGQKIGRGSGSIATRAG